MVKTPKLYFTDTGLLAYLIKYPSAETVMAGPQAGAFFENMVIIEALKRKFNHGLQCELYFYRDSNHNEADLLLDFGQRLVLAEIKSTKNVTAKFAEFVKHVPFKDRPAYVVSFLEHDLAFKSGSESYLLAKIRPCQTVARTSATWIYTVRKRAGIYIIIWVKVLDGNIKKCLIISMLVAGTFSAPCAAAALHISTSSVRLLD